jgi:hypothetical protein
MPLSLWPQAAHVLAMVRMSCATTPPTLLIRNAASGTLGGWFAAGVVVD